MYREPVVREKLCRRLRRQNYQVRWACDGRDALLGSDVRQAHLALIDLDEPPPDGWAILPAATEIHPLLLTVGLTERSDLKERAVRAGLSALVEKPIHVKSLLLLLEELFAQAPRGLEGLRFVPRKSYNSPPSWSPWLAGQTTLRPSSSARASTSEV